MEEIWKDINDFEGLYKVSNLGSIKSLITNKILKTPINRYGYNYINFRKNKKNYNKLIHRLVAIAFIPNLKNKLQVNHINAIKTDNRIENLEWATAQENMNHAESMGLLKLRNKAALKASSKQTIDLNTGIIFDSMKQACESLNLNYNLQKSRIQNKINFRLQYI